MGLSREQRKPVPRLCTFFLGLLMVVKPAAFAAAYAAPAASAVSKVEAAQIDALALQSDARLELSSVCRVHAWRVARGVQPAGEARKALLSFALRLLPRDVARVILSRPPTLCHIVKSNLALHLPALNMGNAKRG